MIPRKTGRRHVVHRTVRGRVVYYRKRHIFTVKDAVRVAKSALFPEEISNSADDVFSIARRVVEFEFLFIIALAARLGFSVGSAVLETVVQFVAQLFSIKREDL